MKLSHFQFDLPKELLAEFPSEHRDEARLMVIDRKKQTIEHKTFKDVIDYFDDGDVLILNNTKVFPRLYGNKEKNRTESKFFT
jgi:S-adenosylmethionine:tRNA ribosyltransferase-isomerase